MYKTRQGKALTLDDIPNCSLSDQKTLVLLADEDIDLEYLSAAIEENPTITGAIIGLANSAYFGSPVKIFTVKDATIKVLGMQTVKSLAISIILGASLDLRRCSSFSPILYWTHALATACCSQQLIKSCPVSCRLDADQAYLCGLLASFGQLLLAHLFPDEMSAPSLSENRLLADLTAEQLRHTGMDQGMAGSVLARRWKLPTQVKTVIQYHHDPSYRGEYWQLNRVIGDTAQLIRNLQYQCESTDRCTSIDSHTDDSRADDSRNDADGRLQLDLTDVATAQLAGVLDLTEAELIALLQGLPSIVESISGIAKHFAANG